MVSDGFLMGQWDNAYRRGNGAIVRRGTLSGEVDAVGSLELNLKLGCGELAGLQGQTEGIGLTSSGVVEVLVDELEGASQQLRRTAGQWQRGVHRWRTWRCR